MKYGGACISHLLCSSQINLFMKSNSDIHPLLKAQLDRLQHTTLNPSDLTAIFKEISQVFTKFETSEQQLQQLLDIQQKQKKHADLKIENFIRRAEKIVNNITEVVFEIDLNGNWIYLNPAWEQLTGLKVIDCLGKPYRTHLEYFKIANCGVFDDFFQSDSKACCQVLNLNHSKQQFWYEVNVKKLFSPNGKPTVLIGTISDITEQKNKEITLMRDKDRETLSNKAKDEFLSTISHEIRTPLNAVIGTTHLLLMENPEERQLENLNVLKHASEHLLSLVNDILDFGKIDTGKVALEKTPFSLDNRLNALYATYSKMAAENGIGFNLNKDKRIPKHLLGDPTRLMQVLTNLVGNAIKFTQQGEVALNILQSKRTNTKATVTFEIVDTGIGISNDQQPKIFEAFTQADISINRKFGGSGLGLSICKKLISLMGGDIKVKSELGVGSVFSFELSFDIAPNQDSELCQKPKNSTLDVLSDIRVLVAEDNKVNILMLKKFLSKWQIEADIVENGKLAVEKCKEETYDIVLMDILMPVMNGFEATKAIRAFDKEVAIVALSASAAAHLAEEYKEGGFDAHLGKPFNPNSLYELMKGLYEAKNENLPYQLGFI